jgi:hypothetical protein
MTSRNEMGKAFFRDEALDSKIYSRMAKSGTSIRKRVFEMLAISLGVALVTILVGIFAKLYFGVSI